MKSSLKKLRGFALHRQDPIDRRRDLTSSAAQLDELAKDIHDMRNCYDSLLSAAAATENSAYEFSESLREMGACLLEKTALSDDEESGRVLLMLGKVQFELQKLVDNYRGHIFQTITTPSESLLSELLTVEEMKRQCDEKRNVYEDMMATQREKRKSRAFKGETFSPEQLQTAHDEYDDEATLFVFRLKSLKQGQTRSLLTQAARHHAAQLNFFSKGLRSLEVVDPHVRSVTEDQRIDYQFSGLEDDADDGYDDNDDHESDINDESEMSFDYEQIDRRLEVSTSRKSMELDQVDLSLRQEATTEAAKENLDRGSVNLHTLSREPRAGSYSAPIFAEKRLDTNERTPKLQPLSSRKFHAYVLPTPLDPKSSKSVASINSAPRKHTSLIKTESFWHSSPLEPKEHEKHSRDVKLGGLNSFKSRPVLKESNINSASSRSILPPLAEGFSLRQLDPRSGDAKKIKRDAYSGPITSKAWSVPPVLSSSGPLRSMEPPQIQLLSRVPVFSASSPKVSQISSPPLISAPKITELHELPRPPIVSLITSKNTPLVGHSAPLARSSELSATKKTPLRTSHAVSSLPEPPPSVPRSFSIPSNGQRATALHVSKLLEFPRIKDKAEEAASPPLTPIFFGNTKPTSEVVVYAGRTEGSGD